MIVDTHAHIIVPEILRGAAPEQTWRPQVIWEGGQQWVEFRGKRISSAPREFVYVDKILKELDKSGVDAVLLSAWISLVRYEASPEETLAGCRVQNDALIALSKKYPKRIAAVGMLPMQDIPLAISELERVMESGLKGVAIGTDVNGVYPGDARFRPFWEACEALNAFVFIHPVEGGERPELQEYYMWNVVGNPMETTIAAGHMILSGVMESYPKLKVLLPHAGGTLPYLRGRLDRGFEVRSAINKYISGLPSDFLKMFYFDTITHNRDLLRQLVDFAGPDHVLLGSDYPFGMGNENPAELVRAANLGTEAEAMILGGTASKLFWGE